MSEISSIIPVPKTTSVKCFNDYQPVALPPMKCFEKLLRSHIKSIIPPDQDRTRTAHLHIAKTIKFIYLHISYVDIHEGE